MARLRCAWAGSDPLMVAYHDDEWGTPLHDERRLFEMLCLEGAQAGLSWATILKRREAYRAAYDDFDAGRIASYDDARQDSLLRDARIIRNRAKIGAFRNNARATLALRETEGGLDSFVWGHVEGRPIVNHYEASDQIPAQTALSLALSRALQRRGFRFVGPIVVYAYLQAIGVVNDHVTSCFRHPDNRAVRERPGR